MIEDKIFHFKKNRNPYQLSLDSASDLEDREIILNAIRPIIIFCE